MSSTNNKAQISIDQLQLHSQHQRSEEIKVNNNVGKLFTISILFITVCILAFLAISVSKSTQSLSQKTQIIEPSSQALIPQKWGVASETEQQPADRQQQKKIQLTQIKLSQLQGQLAYIQQQNARLKLAQQQSKRSIDAKQSQIRSLQNQIQQKQKVNIPISTSDKKASSIPMTKRVGKFSPKGSFRRSFPQTPNKLVFTPPFKLYLLNHLDYLHKNNVTSVAEVRCNQKCKQIYSDQKSITVIYINKNYRQLEKSADWVIIRQMGIQHNLVAWAKIAAKNAKKGVTLFLQNMDELRNFNSRYRQFVFQLMKFHDLIYDEASSLNLRRQEGRILLIFSKNPKKSQFPLKKPAKNYIGIQLVLKINENIPYLREWIGYHMNLGIDKFFIYDNNGTVGQPGWSNSTQNKYSFRFECLNMTEQKVIKEWESVWEDYYEHIIYVPWQYTDDKGNIIYAQVQSQGDFMDYFEDVTSYVGFIDSDEMLFSQVDLDFATTLSQYSLQGFSSLRMVQKKFSNRFCMVEQRMININQSFILTNPRRQGQKSFFEMDNFCPWGSIHDGQVYRKKQFILQNSNQWRFNHYNLLAPVIPYYQNRRKTTSTKMTIDNSGFNKYKDVMDKICKGKCSQSFINTCDAVSFKCPEMDKDYPLQNGLKINEAVKWW